MDELVVEAMARWPDVPAVFGWLRLDRRGRWMLVDRGMPGFDERVHGAGSEITSPPIVDFIGRNYEHDERGRWYWQNGPQRVFVDADLAPLVVRVFGSGAGASLVAHTGNRVECVDAAFADAAGNLYLATSEGPAVVHDLDLASLELEIAEDESGEARIAAVTIGPIRHPVRAAGDPAETLRFVRAPRPD